MKTTGGPEYRRKFISFAFLFLEVLKLLSYKVQSVEVLKLGRGQKGLHARLERGSIYTLDPMVVGPYHQHNYTVVITVFELPEMSQRAQNRALEPAC